MKSLKVLAVAVIALGALAIGSWASPDAKEVKGTLNAVDVSNLTVTISGQDYAVRSTVVVIVEHQGRIPFEELPGYIGQRAELKLDSDGAAYKIKIENEERSNSRDRKRKEIKGTLQGIDATNFTVTVNGQSYSVLPSVIVKVEHQGIIAFEQLASYVGQRVELKLNADGSVYKIEVKNESKSDDEDDD